MRFCLPIDPAPRLAVLGVLSIDSHRDFRREIRGSWMRGSDRAGIKTRFVMRGLGSVAEGEAQEHGDMLFVKAPADANRKNGPLLSLVLWWRCAVQAWPQVSLVGKADDDIWVQMTATAAHLRGSLAALAAQPQFTQVDSAPAMFWGLMETFHWSSAKNRPVGFAKKYGGSGARAECFRRHLNANGSLVRPERRASRSEDAWRGAHGHGNLIGPFNFAKGPMYFVSHSLVAQLNADPGLKRHTDDTVRSADGARKERFLPWEDVFTGVALTQSASGKALASVHMHMALYAEGWQFASTPSVLLWHMKAKRASRIGDVERWSSQQSPCVAHEVTLSCGNAYTSCNGQSWLRCMSLHNRTACATNRVHIPGVRTVVAAGST